MKIKEKSGAQMETIRICMKVTVNELMENVDLQEVLFIFNFRAKLLLYNEPLRFAASPSKLSELKPNSISDKAWLAQLLDGYLSLNHVTGIRP